MNDGEQQVDQPDQPGAAGAAEGAAAEPRAEDIKQMYDELGIKAPVPTGKSTKRPKTADVRDKDAAKKGAKDSNTDGKQGADDNKGKSKDAPNPTGDGASGDDSDKKGKEERKDSGKVSDKSEETDGGVRKDKSGGEKDSERAGEGDGEQGTDGTGQEDNKPSSEEEEGKRPGKSDPKIERRFQKFTQELREKDEVIEQLKTKLQDVERKQQEAEISKDDPEYTIDDFRKVRDDQGNILDLDEEQAELAWRRWKDGYEQRKAEREAKFNYEREQERQRDEAQQLLIQSSVEAYDTLVDIMESTPELDENSPQYDDEFAALVLPIIKDTIIYQRGTEPGNEEGRQPVIVGMRMNPKSLLAAMNKLRQSKRSLPLNGLQDTVESAPNVRLPDSGRTSDPTIRAANELYEELGINKRF